MRKPKWASIDNQLKHLTDLGQKTRRQRLAIQRATHARNRCAGFNPWKRFVERMRGRTTPGTIDHFALGDDGEVYACPGRLDMDAIAEIRGLQAKIAAHGAVKIVNERQDGPFSAALRDCRFKDVQATSDGCVTANIVFASKDLTPMQTEAVAKEWQKYKASIVFEGHGNNGYWCPPESNTGTNATVCFDEMKISESFKGKEDEH